MGGGIGLVGAYTFEPVVQFVAPIAAAALIALSFNHFDSRIKGRFGTIGAAGLTALAFVIDPIQDLARGITRGALSLFALFISSAIGYQLASELHSRRQITADDDDEI